jgi:BirA family biotin operon repressor/biotin-[acetyl-CoA-carboxylase] ligase
LALATGVAVAETLAPLLPNRHVGIHWPNDVMADGGKLSGILVETLPDGHHVVGVGINVNNRLSDAPPELQASAATLLDLTGRRHDMEEVLLAFLKNFERELSVLATTPDGIAAHADAICLHRGEILTARQGDRAICGRCLGIAPDGALRLQTPEGETAVYSALISRGGA